MNPSTSIGPTAHIGYHRLNGQDGINAPCGTISRKILAREWTTGDRQARLLRSAERHRIARLYGRASFRPGGHALRRLLEMAAGDFAFAVGHRHVAISFEAGTLNSAACSPSRWVVRCFNIADPNGLGGDLVDLLFLCFDGPGFLANGDTASTDRKVEISIQRIGPAAKAHGAACLVSWVTVCAVFRR